VLAAASAAVAEVYLSAAPSGGTAHGSGGGGSAGDSVKSNPGKHQQLAAVQVCCRRHQILHGTPVIQDPVLRMCTVASIKLRQAHLCHGRLVGRRRAWASGDCCCPANANHRHTSICSDSGLAPLRSSDSAAATAGCAARLKVNIMATKMPGQRDLIHFYVIIPRSSPCRQSK